MSWRRSLLLVVAASVALAALIGLLYGLRDALVVLALLLVPAVAALAVARAAVRHRARLGSLRRQFGLAGAIAAGQLVVAVGTGAALMFVSTHDAVLALVIVVLSGLVAVSTAQLLARGVLADVRGLRDTLVAVGEGARDLAPVPDSGDELAELTEAANATITRLDDTERARRDLIVAVSHDLRTPLTSLRLLAEAVEDEVVTGDTRADYLAQMRTHVHALSGLIDDLFELSRLEAGDVSWSLEQVRLDQLVGETVEAMQSQARAGMIRVLAELDDEMATAQGNPERLQRVLFNLVQNAIRHTPADGSVTVSARAKADEVEVEVSDTGPGIPAEERGRIFEPFFRGGDDRARTGEGAGLGLAISRAIVEAHGGRIWLEDTVRGTSMHFALPRHAA